MNQKHPPEHYDWNLDSPTMDESAAKTFFSLFVKATRKKHKDFWVMKSFAGQTDTQKLLK